MSTLPYKSYAITNSNVKVEVDLGPFYPMRAYVTHVFHSGNDSFEYKYVYDMIGLKPSGVSDWMDLYINKLSKDINTSLKLMLDLGLLGDLISVKLVEAVIEG